MQKKLGIDLGTANTLVYFPGKGIILNEPSVVAISEQDQQILAIGNEANDMIGKTPESIIAYKPMKDGVIADYKATEAMLKYFINKALGKFNLFRPDVLVSVPAGVTSTERRAVIEAAIRAGAKNAYVIKEPILAALGAGIPIQESKGHMIVDIGGGTTDVAVISLGGIVNATSVKCAGNKIDHAISDYIKRKYNLAIGERTSEEIKIKAGAAILVDEEILYKVKGRDFVQGLPRTIEITTNEIVIAIDRELKQIVQAIKDVLQEVPPELASDIIDYGIIITGGSSQLRHLADLVFAKTGVKAKIAEDPLYSVVKGTGIALKHLGSYKKAVTAKKYNF